ncbi:hypothetical protein J5N97_029241 [Dioscorea zingiberensis]|uniref:Cucumisin n=1 Tax=Dioscorea zingiberensis TaxID=325984 RepID=A0A9D5C101_9LILI|nr:hypothetical protein J5N97_029241 [Dioscorea zingiberensis]
MSFFLSLLFFSFLSLSPQCYGEERKVRIIYMGKHKSGSSALSLPSHLAMLKKVLPSGVSSAETLVYSYGRSKSFKGFAARLTDEEAAKFSEMDDVVSVLPNTKLKLHTTRSWDFLGLTQNRTVGLPAERDVVVGLLDTGIWPESVSFSDFGISSAPSKWKGKCETGGTNFTCNNKIIGARYYNSENEFDPSDVKSPRDTEGHGTHTSSTAAGRPVWDASYFGLAKGVARGAVPEARIAMYKVCWLTGCWSADILAAFDDAIADGVDIISVSLGSDFPLQYFEDPIAIGSFHAMEKGILTSNSAGNSGPFPITVSNYAPWSLTVAASSTDRKFVTKVALGNGNTYIGLSINNFNMGQSVFPLIYGGQAVNVSAGSNELISSYCIDGFMNTEKVEGRLVLCNSVLGEETILNAKGLGIIMSSDDFPDVAFTFMYPALIVSTQDAKEILDYIMSTSNPIAVIEVSDEWLDALAPTVVSFSSRGPNPITPDILKPDLTAPGVDILAAWSPAASPTGFPEDERRVDFNIISGTSMSCPHVSGAAAYVKSVHPTWSPAAIKSALMTTAMPMDPRKNEDAEFAYGSGQINPVQAINPGLVFDASEKDYITFLCKQGYNTTTLRLVTGDNSTICTGIGVGKVWDLNYPSFSLSVPDGGYAYGSFYRTVTNVGLPNSTYQAIVFSPENLKISVQPSILTFSQVGEKKSFVVKVNGGKLFQQPIISACITWFDGKHSVRTPLIVYTTILPFDMSDVDSDALTSLRPNLPLARKKLRIGGN